MLRWFFLDMNIPEEFICPITREVMRDPVIAAGLDKFLLTFLALCSFSFLNAVNPH